MNPVVGEGTLRPWSVADIDANAKKGLSEQQIRHLVTTGDENRTSITTENIDKPIAPPGFIRDEDPYEGPKEKRVSLTPQ